MSLPAVREGLRLRECLRSTPRAVWALAVLFTALMALYSVGVPTYHGPDETKHVDMLFAVQEPGGWPAQYDRVMNQRVVASSRAVGYAPGRPPRTAEEVEPLPRRPSFGEVAPDLPSGVDNQMWQHPPLAYAVIGTAVSGLAAMLPPVAEWPSDRVVGLARLVGALLVAPLPLLAFWVTRRLAARQRPAAMIAAVAAVAVPGVAHLGATVTNDGLLITLVGLLGLPLVYAATGDLSVRTAVTTGVVAGLVVLTKGFGLFVPVWVVAAYGLATLRAGRGRRLAAACGGVIALAVSGAVGGWWWLRNLLVLGVIQPRGSPFPPAPEGFTPTFAEWWERVADLTPRSFWGYFGWVEAPLPWPAVWWGSGVLAGAIVVGLVARRRGHPWTRADLLLLLVPLAGTGGILFYGSWGLYLETGERVALHGRYLMPSVVGLAATGGLGLASLLPRRWTAGWLPALALLGAGALHVTAFVAILERFWMVEGAGYADGLDVALAWSPWPPRFVWVAAAVAAAALLWALVELLVGGVVRRRRARGSHSQPARTDVEAEALSPGAPTRSSTATA